MLNRIEIVPEWDNTHSVKLDGEVVFERQPLKDCEDRAKYLESWLGVKGITVIDKPVPE